MWVTEPENNAEKRSWKRSQHISENTGMTQSHRTRTLEVLACKTKYERTTGFSFLSFFGPFFVLASPSATWNTRWTKKHAACRTLLSYLSEWNVLCNRVDLCTTKRYCALDGDYFHFRVDCVTDANSVVKPSIKIWRTWDSFEKIQHFLTEEFLVYVWTLI